MPKFAIPAFAFLVSAGILTSASGPASAQTADTAWDSNYCLYSIATAPPTRLGCVVTDRGRFYFQTFQGEIRGPLSRDELRGIEFLVNGGQQQRPQTERPKTKEMLDFEKYLRDTEQRNIERILRPDCYRCWP